PVHTLGKLADLVYLRSRKNFDVRLDAGGFVELVRQRVGIAGTIENENRNAVDVFVAALTIGLGEPLQFPISNLLFEAKHLSIDSLTGHVRNGLLDYLLGNLSVFGWEAFKEFLELLAADRLVAELNRNLFCYLLEAGRSVICFSCRVLSLVTRFFSSFLLCLLFTCCLVGGNHCRWGVLRSRRCTSILSTRQHSLDGIRLHFVVLHVLFPKNFSLPIEVAKSGI